MFAVGISDNHYATAVNILFVNNFNKEISLKGRMPVRQRVSLINNLVKQNFFEFHKTACEVHCRA